MTRARTRLNLFGAFVLGCLVFLVFLGGYLGWIAALPQVLRGILLIGTFLAACAVGVFLGPLGLFPHIKKMFPADSLEHRALWFVPDLED